MEAPWAGDDLLQTFTMVFGTGIATAIYFGGLSTGREPSEDLVEPLSWETWEIIQGRGGAGLDRVLGARPAPGVSRAWMAPMDGSPTTRCSPPRWASARCGSASSTPAAATPLDDFRRSGLFTPLHRLLQRERPARDLAAALPRRRRPPLGDQLVGRPADEATLLSLGAQLEAARPGWTAGPSWPRPSLREP